MVIHVFIAMAATLVTAGAEWMHARRVHRVRHLAFGRTGQPAVWVRGVPVVRSLAVGAATWGLLFLIFHDPVAGEVDPRAKPSKQLMICLDVSPSMQLEDAGPETKKFSRAVWAGRVVQGILDRIDMETTRISIVAFYTDALPVVQETYDKAVVSNILDGLPMYVAFESGPTAMHLGVSKALDMARRWPSKSATLVVVGDGDASQATVPARIPDSIADTIVIGVGNPVRSSLIAGHSSRQDTLSLKQLAARLGGYFHEGNARHLPSEVLDALTMIQPRAADRLGQSGLALLAATLGCAALALLWPALLLFGRRRAFRSARRIVSRRGRESLGEAIGVGG